MTFGQKLQDARKRAGLSQEQLAEKDDKQYLVRVDDEFMTTSQIMKKITEKKFRIGGNKYKKAVYKLI